MKTALLVCLVVAVVASVASASSLTFKDWQKQHGKVYSSMREETFRKAVWAANMKFIEAHNKDASTSYTLAMNEFGDLSHSEFRRTYLATRFSPNTHTARHATKLHKSIQDPPASKDWRPAGVVTPVKNQGQCGSCWAFSSTGSLEGAHAIKTGNLVSLSEQNLVDCSGAQGNQGCNGGEMFDAFEYVLANGGLDTEASYPYEGRDGKCRYTASNIGANITSYVNVTTDSEPDLQNAVGTIGPVSIGIDASHPSFQFYHTGVYDPTFCSSTNLDHGVLAVGYGTDSSLGKDYWIVKNSWGPSWGEKGYINMVRNQNNKCGVATGAVYPIV